MNIWLNVCYVSCFKYILCWSCTCLVSCLDIINNNKFNSVFNDFLLFCKITILTISFDKLTMHILQLFSDALLFVFFFFFFQAYYSLIKCFLNKLQLMWNSAFIQVNMQYSNFSYEVVGNIITKAEA